MTSVETLVVTFLLNALWQVGLIAGVAAAAAGLARRAPARLRHRLWQTALVASLLLPLSSLPLAPAASTARAGRGSESAARAVGGEALPAASLTGSVAPPGARRVLTLPVLLGRVIAGGYLLFLLWRLIRLGRAWRRTLALRRLEPGPVPRRLALLAQRCRSLLGVTNARLVLTRDVSGPLSVGGRDPVILLPERLADEACPDMLTAVLGHEMAHVRRKDFRSGVLHELLALPIAFHPATQLMQRRLQATREQACDEMVAEELLDARAYARSLVEVARWLVTTAQPAWALGMLDGGALEVRLLRLVRGRRMSLRHSRLATAAGAVLLVASALLASSWSVVAASAGDADSPAPPRSIADVLLDAAQDELRPSDFNYNPAGRPDPFVSASATRPRPGWIPGPPGFAIAEVALRGIVVTARGRIAMILGPDGKTYFVTSGQPFFDGTLTRIEDTALAFRQETLDPSGRQQARELRLSLHPDR
jgi:beta-lactamase regulating signal transducer with metallopeptidase domain